MYGGSGELLSGTGDGYYGMTNYWYTDEGEIAGGTSARIRFESDYWESGDSSGKDSSFIRAYLFVYRYQDGGWVCVASNAIREDDAWSSGSLHDIEVPYNFDSSRYKFRFLARVEFNRAKVDNCVGTLEVNNGTQACSRWLKVFG